MWVEYMPGVWLGLPDPKPQLKAKAQAQTQGKPTPQTKQPKGGKR